MMHNSSKGEPKLLRASHSRLLGLCIIAAIYRIALDVGIRRIAIYHLEVVSNKTVHIKSLYRNLITFFLSFKLIASKMHQLKTQNVTAYSAALANIIIQQTEFN